MLDVHILRMTYTNPEFVAACVSSVEAAAAAAGYPVDVHVVDGLFGHLGASRSLGFSHGTNPYVTTVDDDDMVDVNAFAILAPLLRQGVEAITTGERMLNQATGVVSDYPDCRHHLAVYRRDVLARSDFASFVFYPDQRLLSQVEPIHLPVCVYTHRQHDSGSKNQRRANPKAAADEMARLKPGYMV